VVIRKEEVAFLPDEIKIKDQLVFLEKAKKPSSYFGDGIPHGVLLLTNKRLFFYCTGKGAVETNTSSIISITKSLSNMFIPGIDKIADFASEVAEYGVGKYYDNHANIQSSLSNENSFVVPLERIASCEKFGNYYVPNFGFSKFSLQNKYTRIGFKDTLGIEWFYCIYCANPRNPTNTHFDLRYDKWYNEIYKLISYNKNNITCPKCNSINDNISKFCTNCGSNLISQIV
jgi:hypothetical protein